MKQAIEESKGEIQKMKVIEKSFLNNAKGIKIDDWVDQFKTMNLDISKLKEYYQSLDEDTKAKWIEKSIKKNGGIRIQLEDWSKDFTHHVYSDVVATYPKSKKDIIKFKGCIYPRSNESFRCAFQFSTTEEAKEAFDKLKNGEKALLDYVANLENPEFADCL